MSIAKVIEISANSDKSFEDAIQQGITHANQTVQDIQGAWVKEFKVDIKDGRIADFRVIMKVTFILHDKV